MTTSPGTDYVTRAEFERAMERIDANFERALERIDSKFERALERIDSKFDLLEARVETRIERATVTSIRWTVGLAFGQYALMFGLILFVVSRELAHA